MDTEMLVWNIAAHWVQAGVIATAALSAMWLLKVRAPGYRLLALQLTMLTSLLLPAMQPYVVEAPQQRTPALVNDAAIVHTKFFEVKVASQPQPLPLVDPVQAFLLIIVAGVVLRLSWLTYGVIRLARFGRRATDVAAPQAATALEAEIGVSPRYLLQTGNQGPWTFGPFRPTVALPSRFDSLAPDFQRAVICHELLHIKRRDITVALLEEIAVAVLWFHPWVWLLRARIRVAREQVVDARVVALLGNREEYVRCLVDMSGHDLAPHFSQAGAGMLRPRELRARIDAIFEEVHMSRVRFAVAALSFVSVTIATGLVAIAAMPLRAASMASAATSNEPLPVLVSRFLIAEGPATTVSGTAAAQPQAAQSKALEEIRAAEGKLWAQTVPGVPRKQINTVYPEYPQDVLERGIQGTVVVDITVNPAGEVTTAAVASGPQELRASAFKAALGLKYTKGQSTTPMKVAFQYTLTGTSWGVRIVGDGVANMGLGFRGTPQSGPASTATSSPNEPDTTGTYQVGGDVQPPKKVKDVPPTYPALAQQARVQGAVVMEVRIDENGSVSDVQTLRSIPLLDDAAIDAVKQWQYSPSMRNGVAVPVRMTVTVSFTLRPLARIQVTMPDGRGSTELRADMPTKIYLSDSERFQLIPSRSDGSPDLKVSVFGEDGQSHLGDVVLVPDGPVVQSPTNPSFGLQLVLVR